MSDVVENKPLITISGTVQTTGNVTFQVNLEPGAITSGLGQAVKVLVERLGVQVSVPVVPVVEQSN